MSVVSNATLTYLLTDIAGSTRLWDEHADAMRLAHPRHSDLIAEGVARFGGRVVRERGEGDSRFAVFHRPIDAVQAALSIQQALHSEAWPLPTPLRVRIAIHTDVNPLQNDEDDYASPGVNRCARLRTLAAGGQSLLSRTTFTLLAEPLPPDVEIRSLGVHQLKDLERPEEVFQLCHPSLPDDFPPLLSLNTLPTNLPSQSSSFIGREEEMREVKRLLEQNRLLTLLGAVGTGKTRMSLQVGADLLDRFADGVWLVELAPLSDRTQVWQSVATALRVREEPGRPLPQTLKSALQPKTLLLILDNCEHLIGICAEVAETLLQSCPQVRILASSREVLSVRGEITYQVPPLSLPTSERTIPTERLLDFEAIRLFTERGRATLPTFSLTDANAATIVQVCRRLDGIPLALELAAVRVKTLPPEQLLQGLDDRFQLLTEGDPQQAHRQQTLRSLIDWSYDLLSEQERRLWGRLSLFASGWRLEAAEQVCVGDRIEEWEVLDLLTHLVDKSIVLAEERDGAVRYRMLESLREYGKAQFDGAVEATETRGLYIAFFLAFAEEAQRSLRGPEQAEWVARLDLERENIYLAFDLGLHQAQETKETEAMESLLRMATALSDYWRTCGHLTEGRRRLTAALALPNAPASPAAYASCLNAAGILAWLQSDYAEANALVTQSLALKRPLNDPAGVASALANLGNIAKDSGDYQLARTHFEEGLALAREIGENRVLGILLNSLGAICREQGQFEEAIRLMEESLELRRRAGDRRGISLTLNNLGTALHAIGRNDRARALQEESLALLREIGDRQNMAILLNNLGNRTKEAGDSVAARTYLEEALQITQELGDRQNAAVALVNLAALAEEQGAHAEAVCHYTECLRLCEALGEKLITGYALHGLALSALNREEWERAVVLFAAVEVLRESLGAAPTDRDRAEQEQAWITLRSYLAPERFQALYTQGRSLPLSSALIYALDTNEA